MKISTLFLALPFVSCALFPLAARCEKPAPPDEGFKYTKMYTDDTVASDGTEQVKYTIGEMVLRQDALDGLKEYSITFSTSAEKVDILEAYTQKPGGKRIDAPKNNFQVTASGGRAGASPAFSDETTMTVVFPDVEVGDTVNLTYVRSVIQPLFPKQFSNYESFDKETIYDDARINYSIPLDLHARYKNSGLKETLNRQQDGRQLLSWQYQNKTPDRKEGEDG